MSEIKCPKCGSTSFRAYRKIDKEYRLYTEDSVEIEVFIHEDVDDEIDEVLCMDCDEYLFVKDVIDTPTGQAVIEAVEKKEYVG